MTDMKIKNVVGPLVIIVSYIFLILLIPPKQAPWTSPLQLFQFLIIILIGATAAAIGGSYTGRHFTRSRPRSPLSALLSFISPVIALIPLPAYLLAIGVESNAGIFDIIIVFGLVVGIANVLMDALLVRKATI